MRQIVQWLIGGRGDVAGAHDWRIGFAAEHNNYVILALLLVFAAMIYLTVRSYRREGRAPRRAKIVLGILRGAVLVLVFLVLFRPAVVLRYVNTVYSTLAVLIDDSLSMSFTDRYADPGERARLGGFLGVTPEQLAGLSRSEIARRALGAPGGTLEKLSADHPLVLLRFSTDQPGRESYTRLLGTMDLVQPAGASPTPTTEAADLKATLSSLNAKGYETNIPAALRDAMDRLQGRRIAGIVLVSDGQMTAADGRERLAGALHYAAQRGLSLYSLLVGDPTPPKNLAVTALTGPREARRGTRVEMSAVLSHRNLKGQSATLRLMRRKADQPDWTDAGATVTVTLDGSPEDAERSAGLQTAVLSFEPDELGEFLYKAVAEARPDEANPSDNAAETRLWVSDEKIGVLFISAEADWESRYVKNFLLRQPELYRLSVWQQNADAEVNQAASTGMKLDRLPRTLEELIGSPGGKPHPGYDIVILHDPLPSKEGFDSTFAELLKTFVERHGGGLCYIAGTKYTDPVLRGGPSMKPLADLLPVVVAANTVDAVQRIHQQQPEPWPVELTSYGLEHPVTRLADSTENSAKVWQILPGVFWSHPVATVKPAARVLAVSTDPSRRTDKNEPEPLLAVQPVGRGLVAYLGMEESWRWRFVDDGLQHQRF